MGLWGQLSHHLGSTNPLFGDHLQEMGRGEKGRKSVPKNWARERVQKMGLVGRGESLSENGSLVEEITPFALFRFSSGSGPHLPKPFRSHILGGQKYQVMFSFSIIIFISSSYRQNENVGCYDVFTLCLFFAFL